MPRPKPGCPNRGRRAAVAVFGSVVAWSALSGCARPVAVTPPENLSAAAAQACADVAARLPETLDPIGTRRQTDPESLLTAAWGDPPVALRCGVPRPAALAPTSELVTVDGVDWFPEELANGYLMTSVGRVANIEITVPSQAGPAPSVAAGLAEVIKASDPPVG